jgi:putative ABC transport system ATP-binding protein
MDLVIECDNVSKSFVSGNITVNALASATIQIRKGEIHMIVGPSGCGKTTLLSVIAGILKPTSGKVEVFNQKIFTLSNYELCKFRSQNIGFVFQSFNLIPTLTVAENVAVPLVIQGQELNLAVAQAKLILSKLGLEKRVNMKPSLLSGGEQQRVAIARALIHNPKVVVCDEPTSALDYETGHKILELLVGLQKEEDLTLVIVTHDQRIYDYAHRISHMDDGRVVSTK